MADGTESIKGRMGVGVGWDQSLVKYLHLGKASSIPSFNIFWFSSNLNLASQRRSRSTKHLSTRKGILCDGSMGFKVPKMIFLWTIKFGQWGKKWKVVSKPVKQLRVSERSSSYLDKLRNVLWLFWGLNPTGSLKGFFSQYRQF